MKTTAYSIESQVYIPVEIQKTAILKNFRAWIKREEPVWESNRLGIAATGIFIQVTFAAVMIAILGMADAPTSVFTAGIFFAFLANSLAFAQASMKIVLSTFLVSILFNTGLTVYYVLKMTGHL